MLCDSIFELLLKNVTEPPNKCIMYLACTCTKGVTYIHTRGTSRHQRRRDHYNLCVNVNKTYTYM